ncbi:hypothetical protein PVAP13_5NG444800 [Panicum virgatum]|uniref:Uncharacterized protein n=1 Tax=Panicum virgatum TaxID=38727 RepID=A0A8T0RWZ1_PANVG|nr:hypothetical protein PVAP13_5NG444800 [Panicum virgatum]
MAAALPLRASCWSPLPAIAPARRIRSAPPIRGVMHGRGAPVRMKARPRHMFLPHCQKQKQQGADDQDPEPQDEGGEPDAPDAVDGGKLLREELNKRRAAIRAWRGEPPEAPDMFIKEKDKISNKYVRGMPFLDVETLNVNATILARTIFSRSKKALDLASKVMDIAGSSLHATKISQQTTNQMVRAYTSLFCNIAEDAYHGRVKMEAIISFLDALRGLSAVCHILVEDIVAEVEDGFIKNTITYCMDKHSQEFDNKVNNLKDQFTLATKVHPHKQIVIQILYGGTACAASYVYQMTECHKAALPHIGGRSYT